VPLLRTSVDDASARSSVLGLFAQTAWYREGLGCVLADERPALEAPAPVADDGWPEVALDRRLDAAVDRAFAEPLGTRAVVVLADGRLVAERYADGFDAGTRQLGWSMAKSVTSAMVGRLVAEGELGLDDADLLPAWRADARRDITVEDLLRMSSGLAWDETYGLGTPVTEMLYASRDMGRYAASQPSEADPGTVQEYSSGTTNALCDVLQERTGLGTDLLHEWCSSRSAWLSAGRRADRRRRARLLVLLWATPRDGLASAVVAAGGGVGGPAAGSIRPSSGGRRRGRAERRGRGPTPPTGG
jgi:hypothetical protein